MKRVLRWWQNGGANRTQSAPNEEDHADGTPWQLFSQILEVFSRREFESLVRDIGTERCSKGFSSWEHFVALLFCQLAKPSRCARSASARGPSAKSPTWESRKPPTDRPRLRQRASQLDAVRGLFHRLHRVLKAEDQARHRLKLPGKLYSLDATVISLCLSLFDWSRYRSAKGAVKLHWAGS